MDFAVRDERGEASGETLPKVGFAPWVVDPETPLVSFCSVAFAVPASAGPPTDVVTAGEAVEADVLGEVAGMVGWAWFNLATFSHVLPWGILTCG